MKARSLLEPLGAAGGAVVASALAACARLLNAHRVRPLSSGERSRLHPQFSSEELVGVRVAERCTLPLLPGFVAITLGNTIYVRGSLDRLPPSLLAHELAHVRQFRRLGWVGMTAEYGRLWVAHGYRAHPMEVEAREMEGSRQESARLTAPSRATPRP